MKIKYQFVNETVEIEVDEKWSSVIAELDRQEYNNNHAETRRHSSLDAINLDTTIITEDNDPFIDLMKDMEFRAVYECLSRLSERQRYLLTAVYMEGKSQMDIAAEEGVTFGAVHNALVRAKKTFKKIYEETV